MSKDDYARAVIVEGQRRKITPRGMVIALATCLVESNLTMYANAKVPASMSIPHDAVGSDGYSVGLFQQQVRNTGNGWWWGDAATCMDPTKSAGLFYDRLAKLNYNGPNSPGSYAQAVQGSAFPDRYDTRMADAQAIYDRLSTGAQPVTASVVDPRTLTRITKNSYTPRGLPSPMWIACHTSESMSRVLNLAQYCEGAGVSYNRLVDDRDILVAVEDGNAPWAAMGANKYAYHVCWTSSFAAWSRNQWLDPDAANDGIDERQALRNGAKVIAYWIQQSNVRDHRPIPATWMGGGSVPPWGRNGICGHVDFGSWGGGHHDPGPNFPVDILMADVTEILTGTPVVLPPLPPPVMAPGTNPDKYADWMLYQGNPNNDVNRVMRVQRRLQRAYASYAGHLDVDGDFGPMTKAAVAEFQRRSSIVQDGIVGPMTASALKP